MQAVSTQCSAGTPPEGRAELGVWREGHVIFVAPRPQCPLQEEAADPELARSRPAACRLFGFFI